MGREIERKFLVTGDTWRDGARGIACRQGYLSVDPARTVRVRIMGELGFLTIKGAARGIVRDEFEYNVPVGDAREIMTGMCVGPIIVKTRYTLTHGGREWVVDVFGEENHGLVTAEIELEAEDEQFDVPPWAGTEVTDDHRYANASLVRRPFGMWGK